MSATMQVKSFPLTNEQFGVIRELVHRVSGISLSDGKKDLVRSRLNKRLRTLDLDSYDDYIEMVRRDGSGQELTNLLDAISTNVTEFFREAAHFEFLRKLVQEKAAAGQRRLRIWSAGCSSGQEPYTIAITLLEALDGLRGWDAKVLATDISTNVLDKAQQGIYDAASLGKMDRTLRTRYFGRAPGSGDDTVQVKPEVRRLIRFGRLNLMGDWPMKGPFDAIFCRNVMIYFEKPTQMKLVSRYWDLLAPSGVLFIGHSENLRGFEHKFDPVQPTVYRKAK
jgi:chemotaxis protein methyltransferase CheR